MLWLAAALVVLAWLTAAATAVRSVGRIWLRHWVDRRLLGASGTDGFVERPQRLLHAAAAGAAATVAGAGLLIGTRDTASGWPTVAEAAVFALAMLSVAHLIPRAIARHWAPRLLPVLLPGLRAVAILVSPVVGAAQFVARMLGRPAPAPASESARDGIENLLREGELEGVSERQESEIISGVVQFGDKLLGDAMTPRTEVFAVDVSTAPRAIVRAIAAAGYSRTPVYRDSLDEVIGMLHVFDVLDYGGDVLPPLRQVAHAPASKRCSEMLFEMLRAQRHLAIVVDEYGGTAGIVTLEDLLEELVGDIRDEHDEPDTPAPARDTRAAVFDATAAVGDVAAHFGVVLRGTTEQAAHPLGGILARAAGRIPGVGDLFRLGDLELTVVEVQRTRVTRVLAQRAGAGAAIDVTFAS